MSLSKDQRVEIVLLSGQIGLSHRQIAEQMIAKYPELSIVHATVGKIIRKFRETGSVLDKQRSGRPSVDEDTKTVILAKVVASPKKSLRRTSTELGIPKSTIHKMLKLYKFHPYKIQLLQNLNDDDYDRRSEMCEWFIAQIHDNHTFLNDIMFSDEACFHVSSEVNKQNMRYWSQDNPHWMRDDKIQGSPKVTVWCGLWGVRLIGPFFFYETVNGERYLEMLQQQLLPKLDEVGYKPTWFQQDGAPPHYAVRVRNWLNQTFDNWIGRRGKVEWAPRSPDLTPLDFFLWGYIKHQVYQIRIRDLAHLEERILEACNEVRQNEAILQNVLHEISFRFQKCYDVRGEHFEHL